MPRTQAENELGSIIDPNFSEGSNGEFVSALRRVKNHIAPNHAELKWRELVEELSNRTGMPQQVRESVIQYHKANRSKLSRLRRRELAVALIFDYSRNYSNALRSIKELAAATGADARFARRYVMLLGFESGLKPEYKPPEHYVSVFGLKLNLDPAVVGKGMEYAHEYHLKSFGSSSPRTIAASALYLASKSNGTHYTQREIANTFGIAEYTVREVSAKMRSALEASPSTR